MFKREKNEFGVEPIKINTPAGQMDGNFQQGCGKAKVGPRDLEIESRLQKRVTKKEELRPRDRMSLPGERIEERMEKRVKGRFSGKTYI